MNLWIIHQSETNNKKWKIEPKRHPWIIGTSKEAQLRITKPGNPQVFGVFQFEEQNWTFTNLTPPNPEDKNLHRKLKIVGPTDISVSDLVFKVIPLTEKPKLLAADERALLSEGNVIKNSLGEMKKLHWSHFFEKDAAPFLLGALAVSMILVLFVLLNSNNSAHSTSKDADNKELVLRTVELQQHFPVKSKALTQAMKNSVAPQHQTQQSSGNAVSNSKKVIGSIFNKIQGKSLQRAIKNITISAQSKNLIAGVLNKNMTSLSKSLPDSKVLSAASSQGTGQGIGGPVGINTVGSGQGGSGVASYGTMAHGESGNAHIGLMSDESDVQGGLSREVIAAYIQSQLGPILFCYERQLSANPQLYGKVAVRFSIKGDGYVESSEISETTLKSKSVESCLLSQVNKWKFPKPQGGTKVVVTYPFMFKSVN